MVGSMDDESKCRQYLSHIGDDPNVHLVLNLLGKWYENKLTFTAGCMI